MTLKNPAEYEGLAMHRVSGPGAGKQRTRDQPWDASPVDAQRMRHEHVRDSELAMF